MGEAYYPRFQCSEIPDVPDSAVVPADYELTENDRTRLEGMHKGDIISAYYGFPEVQLDMLARLKAAHRIGAVNLFFIQCTLPDGKVDWDKVATHPRNHYVVSHTPFSEPTTARVLPLKLQPAEPPIDLQREVV